MHKMIRVLSVVLICMLICLCGCATTAETTVSSEKLLAVHVLNVGDAESIFVQLPDGKNLLIDGGEHWNANDIIAYLKDFGVEKLDVVVATHPHSDHIGGLPQIISAFQTDAVYMPDAVHTTKTYEQLLEVLETQNIPVYQAKAGVVLYDEEYKAAFLAPCSDYYESLNNYSAVLKLEYKEKSFLFTGDMEKLAEKEVLKNYKDMLNADVLKVCHHGSETSSSEKFLQAVSPEYALISGGGKNGKYDNPDGKVLARLKETGCEIMQTDLHGNLVIKTDGLSWRK